MARGIFAKHLSFGWSGLIALCIFIGLLVPTIEGSDLRFALLNFIHLRFGDKVLFEFVSGPLMWHGLEYWQAGIRPFSLCYILLLLYFWPGGAPRWWWAAVVLWALLNPALLWLKAPMMQIFAIIGPRYRPDAYHQFIYASIFCRSLEVLVLWRVTRSRLATFPVALATGIGILYWLVELLAGPGTVSNASFYLAVCGWHAAVIIGVGSWITRENMRLRREAHEGPVCPKCGYAIEGLPGPTCPECGAAIAEQPDTGPHATGTLAT